MLSLIRQGDGRDESILGDAVVLGAVKRSLEAWEIFVTDVEAAVVLNPVCELVAADGTGVMSVHIFEETLAIKGELVALGLHLSIRLYKEAEEGGDLL